MDRQRFNEYIVQRTAEQLGMKPVVVRKIVRQYFESMKKLIEPIDFANLTPETYKKLYRRGFYIPNFGRFVMNWKIIEAYQKKYNNNLEELKNDQD